MYMHAYYTRTKLIRLLRIFSMISIYWVYVPIVYVLHPANFHFSRLI